MKKANKSRLTLFASLVVVANMLNAGEGNQQRVREKVENMENESVEAYLEEDYEVIKEARENYYNIINEYPESYFAYSALADAYYYLGEYEKSIEKAEKAIEINPDHRPAYPTIGSCYIVIGSRYEEQNRIEEARMYYIKAKEKFEKALEFETTELQESMDKMHIGNLENVIERIEKDKIDERIENLRELARVAADKEDYINAAEYLEKILEIEPRPEYVTSALNYSYSRIGRYYRWGKDYNKALKYYKKILEEFPDYRPERTHKELANIYKELSEYEKAKKHFTEVLKINPENRGALWGLEEVEEKLQEDDN